MELNIKNQASRILIERTDNGIIVYSISEDNLVETKLVYPVYQKTGLLDFYEIGSFFIDLLEELRIPASEIETNRKLNILISRLDSTKPMSGENESNFEDDNDTDD